MTPLSRLDMEECPPNVPPDVWTLFVREADKVRAMGREHYSARTLSEFIRHHRVINPMGTDYVLNNNVIPAMARAYMKMRGCWRFFEIRDKRAA